MANFPSQKMLKAIIRIYEKRLHEEWSIMAPDTTPEPLEIFKCCWDCWGSLLKAIHAA